MNVKAVSSAIILLGLSCQGSTSQREQLKPEAVIASPVFTKVSEIPLPTGYAREQATGNSFATWLRRVSLKKDNTVYLYNGAEKRNQSAQFAVLDISVGDRDLQQCADAVMRLRAEYLYDQKKYDAIEFTDNEGGIYKFDAPYSRERFNRYLQKVFGMCGSASLSRQLKSRNIMDMKAGDVLIKGGFPGHAVIVMDMAQNEAGEKLYLLAQSYMPAQDIHILNNPNNAAISPWYKLSIEKDIYTPEYYFTSNQLKTW